MTKIIVAYTIDYYLKCVFTLSILLLRAKSSDPILIDHAHKECVDRFSRFNFELQADHRKCISLSMC